VFVARMLKMVGTCRIVVGNPVEKDCWRDLNVYERSGSGNLYLLQGVQTRSGILPASCTADFGVSVPAGKAAGT